MDNRTEEIVKALEVKASAKQFIYRKTFEIFTLFKEQIKELATDVGTSIGEIDKTVEVSARDSGNFESELKFSGDTLLFLMHTNVFNFPPEHFIHKSD